MKESNEWVRQPMVDRAADELVVARGCMPSEVTAYQIAKKLGCEPNGALYAKVRDWRRRRQDEIGLAAIDVPPGAEAEFRLMLDQFASEAIDHFVRTVRRVGGDLDRSASLRVADAERRKTEAEAETAEVLEMCQRAEAERETAEVEIEALKQALAEAQRREDNLRGRLEQREHDAAKPNDSAKADETGLADQAAATVPSDTADDDTPTQQEMGFSDKEAPE